MLDSAELDHEVVEIPLQVNRRIAAIRFRARLKSAEVVGLARVESDVMDIFHDVPGDYRDVGASINEEPNISRRKSSARNKRPGDWNERERLW